MTIINATPSNFWDQVVRSAQPGDTVVCASGTYDEFHLYKLPKAAPGITIKPADGATVLFQGITLDNSGGYTFDGITSAGSVLFVNDSNMHFKNGKVINGKDPAVFITGIMIRSATNCTVYNTEITGCGCGVVFYDNPVGGHKLINSYIHDIVGPDAIDVFSSSNIEIGSNTIHDIFPGVGDHPDACQVDSPVQGGTRTTNVSIHDNYYYRGVNSFNGNVAQGAQGIAFCANADNVVIKHNANFGAMYNNVSISACNNVVVDDNYCVSYSQGDLPYSGNMVVRGGSTNVAVTNNVENYAGTYVPTGDPPLVNCTFTGNTQIPTAKNKDDRSTLDAWLAMHPYCGSTLANVSTPVVTPPIIDPKDATIADLQNQLSVANKAITDLTNSFTISQNQVTKLTATNKTLYARIGTLQYWLKRLKSEIDTALTV